MYEDSLVSPTAGLLGTSSFRRWLRSSWKQGRQNIFIFVNVYLESRQTEGGPASVVF